MYAMDPNDLPPFLQALFAQQGAAQVESARQQIDGSHIRQWLLELDEPTGRYLELMLYETIQNPAALGTFMTMLRTSRHLRFGKCLHCGEDHLGMDDAGVGHTNHRPTMPTSTPEPAPVIPDPEFIDLETRGNPSPEFQTPPWHDRLKAQWEKFLDWWAAR